MEEPVERKDAAVGVATKEPLKTEGLVPSPDTSETRSEGASSPPPNCSICLGKLRNTSFTDSCLHQFCFTCLLQWSKIKTECPLCKQTFKSIIHNVRSEEDYDQYHVPRELAAQLPTQQIPALDVNFDSAILEGVVDQDFRRFFYRTTMRQNRRYGVLLNPEQVARREQIPNMMLTNDVSREERRFRRANPMGYRRNVYQQGEWANPIVAGRMREHSAEYYRRNPHEMNRLIPWINRELQMLLNANDSHIAYVLNVITDMLPRYDIRSPEFRDTVRPYFGPYTEHFSHELLNYARTSFDIVGYDLNVTYPGRGSMSVEHIENLLSPAGSVSSSTSSDDSDVRVVDRWRNNDRLIDVSRNSSVEVPSVGPHVIDMPGPSTVGETFQVPRMTSGPDILTISSSSSVSSDECEVVGYVKPRHERTPEIIELLSSDGGGEPANNRDARSRSPCEARENDGDRAAGAGPGPGPSHEEHQRRSGTNANGQRSGRQQQQQQRRSSIAGRTATIGSGSNTNDDSEPTTTTAAAATAAAPSSSRSRRRRRKSSRADVPRPRPRKSARKTRTTAADEDSMNDRPTTSSRRRSVGRSAETSAGKPPSGGFDLILGFASGRSCNWRRGEKKLTTCIKPPSSDSNGGGGGGGDASNASRSRSSSSSTSRSSRSSSSRGDDGDRSAAPKSRREKSRKIRASAGGSVKHIIYWGSSNSSNSSNTSTSSSSNSSRSSSSSSSSSTTSNCALCGSDSDTPWSGESMNRRRRGRAKSRRKIASSQPHQAKASRRCQPVNATILRKDSSKPNEWYAVKKKSSSRVTSGSSSSPSRQRRATADQERKAPDQEKRSTLRGAKSRSRSASPSRQRRATPDQERKAPDQEKRSTIRGARSRSRSSSPSRQRRATADQERKAPDQEKRSTLRGAKSRSRSASPSHQRRATADQERKAPDQEKRSMLRGAKSRSRSSTWSSSASPSRRRRTTNDQEKKSRGRSRSSSSSSRCSDAAPRRGTRRADLTSAENPGCSRDAERKNGGRSRSRAKREPAEDDDDSSAESRTDGSVESKSRGGSGISGRTRAQERSRRKIGAKRRRIRSDSSDSGRSRPLAARRKNPESRSQDQAKRKDQEKRSDHGRKREHSSRANEQGKRASDQAKRHDRDRTADQVNRDDHTRKKGETSKSYSEEQRKNADQEKSKGERVLLIGENSTPNREIALISGGARKKDHARRNDDCQPSTSRHSESERKSTSKDKHKKKKQKAKRRRSRSESKSGARNSRHRMERSSSYSPPTTKRDEQQ